MSDTDGPRLTLSEAGYAMRLKGSPDNVAKKARRLIEAKERKLRRQIMLRAGGKGAGVRYVVTLWALKKWLPEMFDRRDVVAMNMRKYTEKLEEKLKKNETLIEHLGELFAALLDKVEALEAAESRRVADHKLNARAAPDGLGVGGARIGEPA